MKTVLHYTGYDDDAGGIVSVIRNLAATGSFRCVLGVNPGCRQRRAPVLEVLELPALAGEKIGLGNFWRARAVARAVQTWLAADATRVFHGHSRAGLLVGLWLCWRGERRVVVSVHCYGRQRWFYRWAAGQLGARLYWLSPAMRDYYGLAGNGDGWKQCIPGGVPPSRVKAARAVPGRLRLGGVGALVTWKGWEVVIMALARLSPADRARVSFQHIGAGEEAERAALLRLVGQHGLGGQVFFAGPEPSPDRLLGEIDALVIAAHAEPFSMAKLEALAAGVPVIAADTGGARDVIRPGVNGDFYRTGDAGALSELIKQWLRKPPAWEIEQIRRSTRGAATMAAEWAEVYARL